MSDEKAEVTPENGRRRPRWGSYLAAAGGALLVTFWTWALLFASKESVNRVGDREWAQRAQVRCAAAVAQRNELVDTTPIDEDRSSLRRRAELLDKATDTIDSMLDDLEADLPDDDKGRAIVPMWIADYRTYVSDRRSYADEVRTGTNSAFREHAVDGIPISDKLQVFATDNEMPACAPPVRE